MRRRPSAPSRRSADLHVTVLDIRSLSKFRSVVRSSKVQFRSVVRSSGEIKKIQEHGSGRNSDCPCRQPLLQVSRRSCPCSFLSSSQCWLWSLRSRQPGSGRQGRGRAGSGGLQEALGHQHAGDCYCSCLLEWDHCVCSDDAHSHCGGVLSPGTSSSPRYRAMTRRTPGCWTGSAGRRAGRRSTCR